MGRNAKRRLSCFLMALLLAVTGLETSAFTGVLAFAGTGRKIDVWDFGAVQEADTTLYNNNITADDWNNCANVGADAKFLAGTTKFGDLTITHNSGDRLYSTSNKTYGTLEVKFDDGYTAMGQYYCNGTGGEGRRHITVANVQAGDKIVVYIAKVVALY